MNIQKAPFLQSDKLVDSQLIFEGAILQLYLNQIRFEDGKIRDRELINHQPAVAIVPILPSDEVILVKQYRAAIDEYIYEIPAGIVDIVNNIEEDYLIAAKRELEEETGYQAKQWQKLGSFYVSPGFLNEEITVFYAHDLTQVERPLSPDEDEFITISTFNRQETIQLIESGQIKDMKTIYGLEHWLNRGE